jgi:hypothetical protein
MCKQYDEAARILVNLEDMARDLSDPFSIALLKADIEQLKTRMTVMRNRRAI